ncbi:hypothetical protein IQ247_16885 [Plectonema cf. radiosum LEGE 06105]|uniref:Uncharacterized protein n=1 Tax=Plectonema cf. radiosum LEGE 06105 TaxID=945769 RepID=A0A8J7F4W3_9CYAN|nr:hypothetical protein [Plectonema radiosum]MBE9214323.1 hypothetical protein [Plectonema cf. radiosum LEGE 06105]
MQIKQLMIAVGGVVSLGLGTVRIAPAQAALLDFSFESENGVRGSFTLDTDAQASDVPADFGFGSGTLYSNAVSDYNLSDSQRGLNFSSETADYQILTNPTPPAADSSVTPPDGGPQFPPGTILSGVVYPSGCSQGVFTCSITVPIFYKGDVTELPKLSDNLNSYSIERVEFFDINPQTQSLEVTRDIFTSSNIIFRTASVPEANSSLSLFALGIVSAGLLFKNKLNKAA